MALTDTEEEGVLAVIGRFGMTIRQLEGHLNQQTALIAEKNAEIAGVCAERDELRQLLEDLTEQLAEVPTA